MEPSFVAMNVENISLGGLGLLAGILMNNVGKYLIDRYAITSVNVIIVVQMVLSSFLLTLVYRRLKRLDMLWRNDISAAFFVSFFFGVQYVTFVRIQAAYGAHKSRM